MMLHYFIAILAILKSSAALEVGESCTTQNGEEGICGGYTTCKDKLFGQTPKVCRYSPKEAIVCCPEKVEGNERISVERCNSYISNSIDRVTILGLSLLMSTQKTYDIPKCDYSQPLIVGGEITKPGEFPHMAAIGWLASDDVDNEDPSGEKYSFDCGGTLISRKFILTAAHCQKQWPAVIARLGAQNVYKNDRGQPTDYEIEEFIPYPDYKGISKYNDIALYKLKEKVRFTKFIRPACLWTGPDFNNSMKVIATGYGADESGEKTNELLKVSLNILQEEDCKGLLNRKFNKLSDSQMCVGDLRGGKDTCQGDSGGPLQVKLNDTKCVYHVLGITSFGSVCGVASGAVYTKVSTFLDWIERYAWDGE